MPDRPRPARGSHRATRPGGKAKPRMPRMPGSAGPPGGAGSVGNAEPPGQAARTAAPAPAARPAPAGQAVPAVPQPGKQAAGYLLILAVTMAGLLLAWHGDRFAELGTGLVGVALLAAAVGRLTLPPRFVGMLACRRPSVDAVTFAILGGGVLGLTLGL